jgi:hypothetical protein
MKWIALFLTGAVGIAGVHEEQPDPARRVRERLAASRITLDFTDAPLADVIACFEEFSGLNFHIEEEARSARITLKVKDVSMKAALRLILHPRDLRCVFRNQVIVIGTKDRLGGRMVTRVYDIREIMLPVRDFAGPRMELQPPGSMLIGCLIVFEPDDRPRAICEELVADLIKTCIGDASWEGEASISQVNGLLVVSQTSAIHDEVGRLLDRLRLYK